MSDGVGLLSLVGSACCCIAVFLVALVGFSYAFRPRRPRGADVKGIAPAPARGVQTQASLTRMDLEEPTARAPARSLGSAPNAPKPGAPTDAAPPKPETRAGPTLAPSLSGPPGMPHDATQPVAPLVPPIPPPIPPTPSGTAPPPIPPVTTVSPSAPPPIPPATTPPPPGGPPPIPPGTRLLSPSVTIAPGSGAEPPPPPPRKD